MADIFEASAVHQADQPALTYGDRTLRYDELDALADIAAHRLMATHGVRQGMIVGLWLPRGIDLLVSQLAITKTGAAWLPLDSQAPIERVAACLQDAGVAVLINDESLRSAGPLPETLVVLNAGALCAPLLEETPLRRRSGVAPDDVAYVIYTSGSTGKPKGIAVSQRSICHFLRSENALLGIRAQDRVYQGFSISFDMSFEEIWISYLVGASLWIGPPESASDPDLLPRLLTDNGITVLHAVPTLLSLFAHDAPTLRLINLGGEACPAALVDRWARTGRQIFNSYGPTEATVSASLAELKAGDAVTIGRPLPNYVLLVIAPIDDSAWADDSSASLTLQTAGEAGELCIAGPGVALGYMSRPELTARKFLPNPWATDDSDRRLYRTGDLARVDASGQVQCLGRTDDQIKIRGFRVELGEIEVTLGQQAGIGTAAVLMRNDDGVEQLVAYLVAAAGEAIPCIPDLRRSLAGILPAYMVPARYEVLPGMPRIPSGKIDRQALRMLPLAPQTATESDSPDGAAEEILFAALAQLFPGQSLRRGLDFFTDLGGHSLMAARLVSALRRDPRLAHATVRDLYRLRQIGAFGVALQKQLETQLQASKTGTAQAPRTFVIHSAWRRWRCGAAQGLVVQLMILLKMAQWLAPFFTYHFFTGEPDDSILLAALMSTGTFLLATVLEFVAALAGKWLVAGRMKAGSYPLWGWVYFRWWFADRLLDAAPTYMIAGSSLYVVWLRALGARIGSDVMVGSITLRVPELLSIDDGASVGNAVNLENACVRNGELHLGQIDIGRDCVVGSFSVIEGDVALSDGAHLQGQTALRSGERVGGGEVWAGSPAQQVGRDDPSTRPPRPLVGRLRLRFEAVCFVIGSLGVATAFFMPVFPVFMLIDWLDIEEISIRPLLEAHTITEIQAFALRLIKFFTLAMPGSVVLIIMTMLLSAGVRWVFLPRMSAGSWPVHSNRYLAKWLVNQIQEASLSVLHGIYATVYSATWYRLLGARVGRDAELSTALGVVPDMLTLGDETFVADAVMLGDETIVGGWMTVKQTVVSNRSFIGNGTYIPDGTVIPENVLIGVLSTVPPNASMKSGDTWLGSPAMHLPAREMTRDTLDALTYRPPMRRRVGRGAIEAFRIAAPHALIIAIGYAIVLDAMPMASADQWGKVVVELASAAVLFGLSMFGWVVILKWLLIGRYGQTSAPMWTPFVWLSEAVTNMYEGIAVPNLLRYLRGTPLLPLAMNLLGCRIAATAWLDTTDFTEFDCVHIGAHSELNAMCCPQTHLFEDRVMKIDHVFIGDRVTLGPRCNVLYGAHVGNDVDLGPLTLVMKGESLPQGTAWQGVPATQR